MGKLRALFTPRDMSRGTPWKRLAEFAFPLPVGNFVQQLYNSVDAVVVGNGKWGYAALGAVGNASGLTQGIFSCAMMLVRRLEEKTAPAHGAGAERKELRCAK